MDANEELELVPVMVRVEAFAGRQERERRESAQVRRAITEESTFDWRSYERRAVPSRWRVR